MTRVGILALTVLVASCASVTKHETRHVATPQPVAAPVDAPRPQTATSLPDATPIDRHIWAALNEGPAVPWKGPAFGMYTYVLFTGSVTTPMTYREQLAYNRLKTLLATIAKPDNVMNALGNEARESTNLFLIPGSRLNTKTAEIVYYPSLSHMYRIYFMAALSRNTELSQRLRKGQGPFLLATLQPINETVKPKAGQKGYVVDDKQPILLVDLTGANEKSVAEVVRTFKTHVANVPLTRTDSLEPLRLKLVSLLLDVNDAIPLVRNAVAGTCKTIGIEKSCAQ
ncbi:MAG TPA: hypothetical protein VEC35_24925 [Noviherbaspirillum sp.]|nr:hypothetical protein [Noviherbaspirillum sp.]